MSGDSTKIVTLELCLEVGIGIQVKREEKGIMRRILNAKRTGRDESIE